MSWWDPRSWCSDCPEGSSSPRETYMSLIPRSPLFFTTNKHTDTDLSVELASGPSSRRQKQMCKPSLPSGFSTGHQWPFGEGLARPPSAAPSHHWRILNHLRFLHTKCGLHPPDMPRCRSHFQTCLGKWLCPGRSKVSNEVLSEAVTEISSDKDHRLLDLSSFPSEQDTAWSPRCELWFRPVVCHFAFWLCDTS